MPPGAARRGVHGLICIRPAIRGRRTRAGDRETNPAGTRRLLPRPTGAGAHGLRVLEQAHLRDQLDAAGPTRVWRVFGSRAHALLEPVPVAFRNEVSTLPRAVSRVGV